MADTLRIVRFTKGNRPIVEKVLDNQVSVIRLRDTFTFNPASAKQQFAESGRRYGGSSVVGETHENGTITWQALIKATSQDVAASYVEQYLAEVEETALGRYIEWRPDGNSASRSTYFSIVGPGTWTPGYKWVEWQQAAAMPVTVTFPVKPLAEWARCTIGEVGNPQQGGINLFPNGQGKYNGQFAISGSGFTTGPFSSVPVRADGTTCVQVGSTKDNTATARTCRIATSPVTLMPVDPYLPVSVRVDALALDGSAQAGAGYFMYVEFYDSTSTTLGSTLVASTSTHPTTVVTLKAENIIPPKNAAFVTVAIDVGTNVASDVMSHQYTNWMVAQTDSVPEFVLGDSMLNEFTFDNPVADFALNFAHAGSGSNSDCLFGGTSSLAVERRMRHTSRGYRWKEGYGRLDFAVGTILTSFKVGIVLRGIDSQNYVEGYVQNTGGANYSVTIDQVLNGVRSTLSTTTIPSNVPVAGSRSAVTFLIQDSRVTCEYWLRPDQIGQSASPNGSTSATASITLASDGFPGIVWTPSQSTAYIANYYFNPYYFRNPRLPSDTMTLRGVPGTAPAKVGVETWFNTQASNPMTWALWGWSPKPPPYNMLVNGGFDNSLATTGWSTGTISGIQTTGATHSSIGTEELYGSNQSSVSLPVGTDVGIAYPIYRRFKRAVTYTFKMWVRLSSGAGPVNARLKLGRSGDLTTGTNVSIPAAGAHQELSISWTPTSDTDLAYACFNVPTSAGTIVFQVDGGRVFEGGLEPAFPSHREGMGALPPFGVIEGEAATITAGNYQITADASCLSGFKLADPSPSGAKTYTVSWIIDPSLLTPDTFVQGSVNVEFWAMVEVGSGVVSPQWTLSASTGDRNTLGSTRYTAEWGNIGRGYPAAAAGAANLRRMIRLGSIDLPVNRADPRSVELVYSHSVATGTTSGCSNGLDFLVAVPSRARAVLPTGVVSGSTYPAFSSISSTRSVKTVEYDLSATVGAPDRPPMADSGMGGSLIELPPGDNLFFKMFWSLIPESPTVDSTTGVTEVAETSVFNVTPRSRLMRSSGG